VKACVAVACAVWGVLAPAGAWAQTGNEAHQYVTLRDTFGRSGEDIRVSMYVESKPDVALSSITFQVDVPTQFLSFVKIEPGFLAEDSGVRVLAHQDGSTVTVEVRSTAKGGRAAIPAGLLGALIFQTVADVEGDTRVELPVRNLTLAGVGGDTFKGGESAAAVVTILPSGTPALVACFFFMH
jgi:hypothetical protein